MDTKAGYPVMLRLHGRPVVIVGGGRVAERKVLGLLDTGAQIIIISPTLTSALEHLADAGQIKVMQVAYHDGLLQETNPVLLFAATDSAVVNQQVARDAQVLGVLVDVADTSIESDFNSMAAVRRGRLTIAISTDGGAPALAAYVKNHIEAAIGQEYATLLDWMAELRPQAKQEIVGEAKRRALWTAILESSALELLREGHVATARQVVMETLHTVISEDNS